MAEQSPSIAEALGQQLTDARLRVLIVGAGIAGATLGALLRRHGEPAAIIERHGSATSTRGLGSENRNLMRAIR